MNILQFVLAWRNLNKRRFYTLLQVGGLAVGIACFLLTMVYVRKELSYDSFFTEADRTYRVLNHEETTGNRYSGGASALGYHAAREIPEVEEVVRVFFPYRNYSTSALVTHGDNTFYEDNIIEADSNFFRLFDFEFLEGNRDAALRHTNAVVLSDRAASRLFGDAPALGKLIGIDGDLSLEVAGVARVPGNTHLDFDFLRPAHRDRAQLYVWDHTLAFTYLKIPDPGALPKVSQALFNIVMTHGMNAHADYLRNYRHMLQPITTIHTDLLQWDIVRAVSKSQLWIILGIGAAILALSITNFVNLATARAAERIRESSISRIMGASKGRVVRQFFIEFSIVVFVAGIGAVGLLWLFVPVFNATVGVNLSWFDLWSGNSIMLVASVLILTTILSGLYPAWRLSVFSPVQAVRGRAIGDGNGSLRFLLVGFQFVVSISLVCATLIVNDQLDFLQVADLGFNKQNVYVLRLRETSREQFEQLRGRLQMHPQVSGIAGASALLGGEPGSTTFHPEHMPDPTPETFAKNIAVDASFIGLMGIGIVEGRGFQDVSNADYDNRFIVNQAAVRQFQLTSPVGASFRRDQDDHGSIIGVMKDFHFTSMRDPIGPMVFFMDSIRSYRYMFARLQGELPDVLADIDREWSALFPQRPIEGFFQDQFFNRQYAQELQVMTISRWFTIVATLLASVGLLGMCAFTLSKVMKELSIRKILGASLQDIIILLGRLMLLPIAVAFAISVPLTIWMMGMWLNGFEQHIAIGIDLVLIAALSVIVVVFVTIGYQSVIAARSNPVDTLREQ